MNQKSGYVKSGNLVSIAKEHRFFILLIILGILIRIAMASGVTSPDSYIFTQHAADLLKGKFNMSIQTYVDFYRYAVWLPVSFFFYILGINDFSATLWPLLCGVGGLVTIYFLGRLLFDEKTALIAVFLLAFLPVEVIASTTILSDIMVEFFSALAILIFVHSEIKSNSSRWKPYLFTGILMGLAINSRMLTAAVLGLTFVVYVFWKRSFKSSCLLILLVIFLVIGSTWLISWRQTGDPFLEYRITAKMTEGQYLSKSDPSSSKFVKVLSLSYYPKALLGFTRLGLANFSFFFYLFLLAAIFCFLKRCKETILLMIWIIPSFLYLQFGVVNFKELIPIWHDERYLTTITIPAVLLVAFFLNEWGLTMKGAYRYRKMVNSIILFLFAITSLYGAYRIKKNSLIDAGAYKAVYAYLKDQPRKTIYCINYKWPLYLNYYFKYTMGYDFFENMTGSDNSLLKLIHNINDFRQIKDAYVVIHNRYIYFDDSGNPLNRRDDLPEYVYSPPTNWQLLNYFELYGKGNKIYVYFAP